MCPSGSSCAQQAVACALQAVACAQQAVACAHQAVACAHQAVACAHQAVACAQQAVACAQQARSRMCPAGSRMCPAAIRQRFRQDGAANLTHLLPPALLALGPLLAYPPSVRTLTHLPTLLALGPLPTYPPGVRSWNLHLCYCLPPFTTTATACHLTTTATVCHLTTTATAYHLTTTATACYCQELELLPLCLLGPGPAAALPHLVPPARTGPHHLPVGHLWRLLHDTAADEGLTSEEALREAASARGACVRAGRRQCGRLVVQERRVGRRACMCVGGGGGLCERLVVQRVRVGGRACMCVWGGGAGSARD